MLTFLTAQQMIDEAKEVADTVDFEKVKALCGSGALVLDVREPNEWQEGHLEGAVAIPRGVLEMKISDEESDHQRPIVTYCASGGRAVLAAATLRKMGYIAALASKAGFDDLQAAGLPCNKPD
ncbi:rhodanese-like domain-containing protein [Colwellia sp. BRX10-3]|uniref:rhodanese-like domain-containing protein n=1 Tax=Colwellia sp. BRX10-3 TaxID=2759844 RepID=UPI002174EE67|nr:rhodanese-like domain-containing protein [Colwellia sp. BRX10-3]|tara:strand:+ start:15626 stop:15994 length:369 start_codon:yes stop_codon:yes gene_type:complete